MTQWYGNYRFSRKDNVKLFNSDMILYFLDHYMGDRELPDDMIDRGDNRFSNGNFDRLREIVKEGETSSKPASGFPLDKLTDREAGGP